MSGTAVELEELREQLASLAQDNAQLRAVLHQVPVAVLIKDRDSRFLQANPAGAAGYGIPAERLVGRLERDVMPPGNGVEEYLATDRLVIDTGQPHLEPERVFHAADGTTFVLTINKYPVDFAGQKAVMIVAFDLTRTSQLMQERAALERKVLETQRLESLGVMAGGIAHDFNNLLVGVLANADLALADPSVGPAATLHIGRLKTAAQRLATLSRQMLAYSGRAVFSTELLDLSEVTDELLDLLAASLPKQARLETDLPSGLPRVQVDPTQIRQVIMNLVANAAEALGARPGTVRITACRDHFDPREHPGLALGAELPAGEHVRLTVIDDGEGMSAHTRERLFDPFFTTKGSGRGLGLAAVLGIVRAHDGALQVTSWPGEGTTFRLWLPVARPSQASAAKEASPGASAGDGAAQATARRATRVLVVDDEPVVRMATSAVLESFGFRVDTAESGGIAIEAARAHADIDVVLLDVTMPGLSVTETHGALRELRPRLPIVLTSGFSEQDVVDELLKLPATSFLAKPYSSQDLVQTLRSAVGG